MECDLHYLGAHTMRQSISTKYHGPTNTRGSKVIATSASGHRLSLEWDDALNNDENHTAAAMALANKLQWTGAWHGGATKTGYCFVNQDGDGFAIVRNN
jgi:hypothetical protein